ncbi:MAG: hypothetical protein ACRECY_03990 [Phyllobacterium sp.]
MNLVVAHFLQPNARPRVLMRMDFWIFSHGNFGKNSFDKNGHDKIGWTAASAAAHIQQFPNAVSG